MLYLQILLDSKNYHVNEYKIWPFSYKIIYTTKIILTLFTNLRIILQLNKQVFISQF